MNRVRGLAAATVVAMCALVALAAPAHAAVRPATPISSQCNAYLLAGQIYVTCNPPNLVRVFYFNAPTRDFCVSGITSIGAPNQIAGYGPIGPCTPA
jgi:hypothetical protein